MEKYRIVVECDTCGKKEELFRRIPVAIEELLPGWITMYEIVDTPNPLKLGENIKLPIYYCPECAKGV